MNNKIVSVIIPIYDVEDYLDQCMASVVHQTYEKLQIIMVDDGSQDNCFEKCDWWAKQDSRIEVIHKKNGGLSDARNTGLRKALGEYVFFLDPDDTLSINTIDTLVKRMIDYDADMVVYRYASVFPNGRVVASPKFNKDNELLNRKEYISIALENDAITNHVWRKLYKRKYIPQEVFPKGKNFEDIYVMAKLAQPCSRILLSNFVGYFYRLNGNGIVSNVSYKNCRDQFEAWKHSEVEVSHIEPDLKNKAKAANLINDLIILNNLSKITKLDRKNKELIKIIKRKIKIEKKQIPNLTKYIKKSDWKLRLKLRFLELNTNSSVKYVGKPIKRFIKYIIKGKNRRALNKNFKYEKKKYNIIILGTPDHGNLGDQALRLGEYEYIRKYLPKYNIFEIPISKLDFAQGIKKSLNSKDRVTLHAGGNIGTLYPEIHNAQQHAITWFRDDDFFIFPQTFFYSKDKCGNRLLMQTRKVYDKMSNFQIFTRDDYSFNFLERVMPEIKVSLMPDMALNLCYKYNYLRQGALLLLRIDSEKKLTWQDDDQVYSILEEKFNDQVYQSDTHLYMDNLSVKQYEHEVINKLDQVAKSKIVVTDRLHGMIFAAITRTPCVVLKSKSPKVRGVYQWIKQNKYIELVDDISDLPQAIERVMVADNSKFDRGIIDQKFEEMAKIIKSM